MSQGELKAAEMKMISFVMSPECLLRFGDNVREANEMVWTSAEKGQWTVWTKAIAYRAAREEAMRTPTGKDDGCNEGVSAEDWCNRGACWDGRDGGR